MSARHDVYKTTPLDAGALVRTHAFQTDAQKRTPPPEKLFSQRTARDLMTASVMTVRPEDSVENAARLMSEVECGALPVVDGSGRLIGIISNGDITNKLIARRISVPHAQVSDCMTDQAFACSVESSAETCIRAMSWHQVKRIPIVDHDHRVVGIISMSDVARYLSEQNEGGPRFGLADVIWQLAG